MDMKFKEEEIYDSLNTHRAVLVIGSSKDDIEKEKGNLNLAIRCLAPVFPINYKELKENNPERFAELYDEDQKRTTLAGFKEELKALISNSKKPTLDSRQKLIKGSDQFESYADALKQIAATTIENAGHTYAKTYNFAKSHAFILIDDDIQEVTDLLSKVLENSLSVQIEEVISSPYCNVDIDTKGFFE